MSCSDGVVAGYQHPVGKAKAYDAQPVTALYISVVSIAEIRFGIELLQDVTRRVELNEWLTQILRRRSCPRVGDRGFLARPARGLEKGKS
jgi:hypothetical protein